MHKMEQSGVNISVYLAINDYGSIVKGTSSCATVTPGDGYGL